MSGIDSRWGALPESLLELGRKARDMTDDGTPSPDDAVLPTADYVRKHYIADPESFVNPYAPVMTSEEKALLDNLDEALRNRLHRARTYRGTALWSPGNSVVACLAVAVENYEYTVRQLLALVENKGTEQEAT